jgi:hypothetical protein
MFYVMFFCSEPKRQHKESVRRSMHVKLNSFYVVGLVSVILDLVTAAEFCGPCITW